MTKSKSGAKNQQEVPVIIVQTANVLQKISSRFTVIFSAKLFTTPIKHKMPKREFSMDKNSKQSILNIPEIKKEVVIYELGNAPKKILLVHGWSGRGTQMFKIAETLVEKGFATISFDAPAHGKAKGNTSIMLEFIASIKEIDKQFGPFEAAIGHSLGGMALFNSVKDGVEFKKLITEISLEHDKIIIPFSFIIMGFKIFETVGMQKRFSNLFILFIEKDFHKIFKQA